MEMITAKEARELTDNGFPIEPFLKAILGRVEQAARVGRSSLVVDDCIGSLSYEQRYKVKDALAGRGFKWEDIPCDIRQPSKASVMISW